MLFAAALTFGLTGMVAVLGSMYPVTTVLLARVVLHDRIALRQELGVGGALVGVALSLSLPRCAPEGEVDVRARVDVTTWSALRSCTAIALLRRRGPRRRR